MEDLFEKLLWCYRMPKITMRQISGENQLENSLFHASLFVASAVGRILSLLSQPGISMRILELWRYPISSIGGERLLSTHVGPAGVPRDRQFGIVDAETGQPAAPEKMPRWRKLLFLSSRAEGLPLPEILFPDGSRIAADDIRLNGALSSFLGFPTMICKYHHTELSHLEMSVAENRYKPAALHVVTQSSINRLSDLVGAPVEATRFRPNILLDGEDEIDFEENSWIGGTMRAGTLCCGVAEPTARCGMTIVAQPDMLENADILRAILRHNKRNFGAYLEVRNEGSIAVGDEASIQYS